MSDEEMLVMTDAAIKNARAQLLALLRIRDELLIRLSQPPTPCEEET